MDSLLVCMYGVHAFRIWAVNEDGGIIQAPPHFEQRTRKEAVLGLVQHVAIHIVRGMNYTDGWTGGSRRFGG